VAGRTLQPWYALAGGAAHDVEHMTMAVVALIRMVGRCMTVDAPGMGEHRIHLLPSSESLGATRGCGESRDRQRDGHKNVPDVCDAAGHERG
jgi:hypothetical protein